ncbi:ribonuclease D [Kaustia mangrovi]|uniref:Ribonuclease D n=1 Tax=Kaustia mangrovi TaxID=2593653 RepID=A0A7S8C7B5_9HYPH|nr:ribonuclease D [Kaustia mangrovi]QPC44726.1 ribonuclease D [Kaustia mangrovi]
MNIITNTEQLDIVCAELAREPFVAVDTEFMRETTYWPNLCLIQMAGESHEVIVDPLADGIDLGPFFRLMADEGVVKVFHSARQDLEIVYQRGDVIPAPLFDTQIAAMVCGFGEQIGYENIVRKLAGAQIDKTSRFTDWSRRPLSDKQLKYAISDVTHLRTVYRKLKTELEQSGRAPWLKEEMATLTSPDTYRAEPAEAWRRLKFRARNKKALGVFIEVAAWREREAQERNVPRNRILKDDALSEIAVHAPADAASLRQLRAVPRGFADSRHADRLIRAIEEGRARDPSSLPDVADDRGGPRENVGVLGDVLKLALKVVCEREGVAAKIIASAAELEMLAADDNADIPALKGWRRQLFGETALALKHGKLAIVIDGKRPRIVARDETYAEAAE